MKILVLVKDESQQDLLIKMEKGVQKQYPKFKWEVTIDPKYFVSAIGYFKILAISSDTMVLGSIYESANLRWEDPVEFLKTPKTKDVIWKQIQEILLSKIEASAIELRKLNMKPEELEALLLYVSNAKKPFILELPNGDTVGVETKDDVDISLSSSELASAIAASLVFGARGIRFK